MNENENILFDCNRGCTVSHDQMNNINCSYTQGCCKQPVYNWLKDIPQEHFKDIFEIRFKNTRKGFYRNNTSQRLKTGDLVVVEAQNGYDLGIITLDGPVVARQMQRKSFNGSLDELKKVHRKALPHDIEKWQEAISREHQVMIRSRQIASSLGLDMKIGDVEFQGDGTKAIFYYIAENRVDFRQLIKLFAEEFRIRIEMKQIGARQEAGMIGGIGVCGRELCCSNHIATFESITISAARCQDLSLNPAKLTGQCGKLKCCLNYEVATYLDAQSKIPRINEALEFEDGPAFLVKTDILKGILYFSYDKNSIIKIYPLDIKQVKEVLKLNSKGFKPESLQARTEEKSPDFVSSVGDDSITRFDKPKRAKSSNKARYENRSKKSNKDFSSRERINKEQFNRKK